MRIHRLHLTNFLSYRDAVLELDDFTALVGPNASGKSNAVTAVKLLRDMYYLGLPTAIARRGGFDQLRHRSHGHPYDPALRVDFALDENSDEECFYELKFAAVPGKRYRVKAERAQVTDGDGDLHMFDYKKGKLRAWSRIRGVHSDENEWPDYDLPEGQSIAVAGVTYAGFMVRQTLRRLQVVEINPARVAELQDPSSVADFEPDGSNVASIYDFLSSSDRDELVSELCAIVPGIDRVEVRRLADKVTLAFFQAGEKGNREFFAEQMSDGTLRTFGILLALLRPAQQGLVVIEEPEIAIHLGAQRTLVDLLQQATTSTGTQVLITTHSADVLDTVDATRSGSCGPRMGPLT